MHEFSIATGIIENVLVCAMTRVGAMVIKVRVPLGELAGADAGPLGFCNHAITRGTALEESER